MWREVGNEVMMIYGFAAREGRCVSGAERKRGGGVRGTWNSPEVLEQEAECRSAVGHS